METKLTIGIADMKMAKGSGMLVTYALGSCIGICLYDPLIKLAAMIHIMLPLNMEAGRQNTMKYADTGIRETLKQMEAKGASRALGNIGQRNIDSVHLNLKKEGIRLLKEDVGGSVARTLLFDPSNGMACVRCYGRPELII